MGRLIGWAPTAKKVSAGYCASLSDGMGLSMGGKGWTMWNPRDSDQAKIGLANGQPGSDTMAIGAGFLGHNIPEINPSCHHQPRITVTGGHTFDTEFQANTRIWVQDHKGPKIQ